MYSFEALSNDRADSKQSGPLRCPVTRTPCAVLLAREYYQRHALGLILHRRFVNAHTVAVRLMHRHSALRSRDHKVFDPHIGERPSSHHAVVTSARAVAVEVRNRHASLLKITAG